MPKPNPKDYEQDVKHEGPTAEQLEKLIGLARQQRRAEMNIEDLTKQMEVAQEELKRLSEIEVPAAMQDAGLEELPLGNGYLLQLKQVVVNGSLKTDPKTPEEVERYKKAFAWLVKLGHEDIIKHTIVASFPRAEAKLFEKFVRDLKKRKKPIAATIKDFVEPQTLKAFIAEQLDDPDFPRELFGVFEKKAAFIVPPKDKKK